MKLGLVNDLIFADKFSDLAIDLAKWSQATFGSDAERGPMGALKHLEKEAQECQEAVGSPQLKTELADCLILLIDASRRAGVKPMQLVEAALDKMEVNKQRTWPSPQAEWEYEGAYYVDSENCMGTPVQYYRVFARNPTWVKGTVCGTGKSPEEALANCKANVIEKINSPVEHVK